MTGFCSNLIGSLLKVCNYVMPYTINPHFKTRNNLHYKAAILKPCTDERNSKKQHFQV